MSGQSGSSMNSRTHQHRVQAPQERGVVGGSAPTETLNPFAQALNATNNQAEGAQLDTDSPFAEEALDLNRVRGGHTTTANLAEQMRLLGESGHVATEDIGITTRSENSLGLGGQIFGHEQRAQQQADQLQEQLDRSVSQQASRAPETSSLQEAQLLYEEERFVEVEKLTQEAKTLAKKTKRSHQHAQSLALHSSEVSDHIADNRSNLVLFRNIVRYLRLSVQAANNPHLTVFHRNASKPKRGSLEVGAHTPSRPDMMASLQAEVPHEVSDSFGE